MSLLIYMDGKFVPEEDAKISVFDHGFLYGDGVFEGIRAYNNRVFKLKEHLDRLYDSARSISLVINESKEEMQEAVLETCRKNNLQDAYIRLVVSRGKGDLGLDPLKCSRSFTAIIASKIKLYPPELYQKGLNLITAATRRTINEALCPRIKSLNYLNNILAKIEANLAGIPEAILLNHDGYVAECTGDNIFVVKDGVVLTPPSYAGILEGITRNTVIEIAKEKGIPVEEKLFNRHDIYVADECFLTGTAAEVIPVSQVDGRTMGESVPGPITTMLIKEFRKVTQIDGPQIFA